MRYFFILVMFIFAAAPAAHGQTKATGGLIDVFGDWSAFANTAGGKSVCYVGSEPQKATGKYAKRGDTLILVTHRPAEKSIGVFSFMAGYTYKPGSEVEVIVGGFKQLLFTDGGHAWARDAKADAALVKAMKGGSGLVVKGASSRGTATVDTYSLKGFTAAYAAASKACGIK